MKKLILLLPFLLLSTSCKKDSETTYADGCRNLWELSGPSEWNLIKDKNEPTIMTNKYIVRCCELIDGGDNPQGQSENEGACMSELLVMVEDAENAKVVIEVTVTK